MTMLAPVFFDVIGGGLIGGGGILGFSNLVYYGNKADAPAHSGRQSSNWIDGRET